MPDIADHAESVETRHREGALAALRLAGQLQRSRESLSECESCGEEIEPQRRRAVPGVRRCVDCQRRLEQQQKGRCS